ncbi:MAG: aldehyde ferredoxin oxidoreductase family protein [Sulfolobales archaeon]
MLYGYSFRMLKINLSTRTITKEEVREQYVRDYIGGLGLGARLYFDLVPPNTEPLSAENVVFLMSGPIQGTLIPGAGRGIFISKSPLTNRFFSSNFGGHLTRELKEAGYDFLVIVGKSDEPVYLVIDDGNVELKKASKLWGMRTYEAQKEIKEELGDQKFQVACIGPAGENLVRISAIIHDIHAAGRGGIAAVLGYKKLKAIAVRGSKKVEVAYPDDILNFFKEITKKARNHPFLVKYGTTAVMETVNKLGGLGTRNWQTEVFEGATKISGQTTIPKYKIKDYACHSCPIGCAKIQMINEGKYAGVWAKGPEYETLYSLGSLTGVDDFPSVVAAARNCDELGLDTISTGVAIAFAMEAYEKGILTKEDCGGLELNFGNSDAMVELVERIGYRKGWLGNVLAEGVARASNIIGYGSQYFAMHFKGLELAGHSPRAVKAWTLGYSVGWRGGSHHDARPHDIEYANPVEVRAFSTDGKPELIRDTILRVMIEESLITCRFFGGYYGVRTPTETHIKIIKMVTGWEPTLNEVITTAERIRNLIRVIEVREGFDSKADKNPPPRVLYEAIPEGPSKGARTSPREFRIMLRRFYELMGWDPESGIPKPEKLKELNLDYALK